MDHHATTPLDPTILDAIKPFYLGSKSEGQCRDAVAVSRERIARLIGADPSEIRFTSGATESDNLAVKGIALARRERGNHIITSQVEHKAILDCCTSLEQQGFVVTYLPVDSDGMVSPEDVSHAINENTILITIAYGNNEIGSINPVNAIGKIARDKGLLLHTDAVQAVGKIPVSVNELGVDLLSISAHKMYGPKGIGALYVRESDPAIKMLSPLGDESLLNLPGIVGLGLACEICEAVMDVEGERLVSLRDHLYRSLSASVDDIKLNGHPVRRLPGNLNVCFSGIEGGSLLLSLRDIAVSSGSACTSRTTIDPSYVLMALGRDRALAESALRFGLGRGNTIEEVDYVVATIAETVGRLRSLLPNYPAS
ncbi:MAG: cysteine desulfurase [Candidatus Latescibacteria bacterium]|jgi:cysteine desulfurase|nr:cysteine desulfurase [Candidatus Latescibacterota bacterium]